MPTLQVGVSFDLPFSFGLVLILSSRFATEGNAATRMEALRLLLGVSCTRCYRSLSWRTCDRTEGIRGSCVSRVQTSRAMFDVCYREHECTRERPIFAWYHPFVDKLYGYCACNLIGTICRAGAHNKRTSWSNLRKHLPKSVYYP